MTMTKGKLGRASSQAIDKHIGARLHQRRLMLGLRQRQLGELLGLSGQQMHKYETGVNQIKASRLFTIAEVLGVEVGYFFQGWNAEEISFQPSLQQRTLLELARNFTNISSERQQEAICKLAQAMADPKRMAEAELVESEEMF